jgi:rhodanese-related sulfurtransferase
MEGSGQESISAEDARMRMGTDASVLDIRPAEEWQTVGNIPGAISTRDGDPAERVRDIPEDRTVIVVDEDGERSADVAKQLRDEGRDAVALEGGMASWVDNNLPMQPTEDPALASDPGSVEDEISQESGTEPSGEGESESEEPARP